MISFYRMMVIVPLVFCGLFQAQATAIIGADGKEYHPAHHGHHHHKHVAKVHPHAKAFGKDVSHDGHHAAASAVHHNATFHLRKKHKVRMLNAHRHMLNHKTEPKEEKEEKKEEKKEGDAAEKEDEKESRKGKKKEEKEDEDEPEKEEKKDEKKKEEKKKDKDEDEEDEKDKDEKAEDGKEAEKEEKASDDDSGSADWTTKKGGPLPVQGYDEYHDGERVEHEDTKTMTSDWRKEFGPKAKGLTSYEEICAKHPDNDWCKLHGGFRRDAHHHYRSDARQFTLALPLIAVLFAIQ